MSYGLDIKNKKDLVGICYSTWFNPIVSENGPKPKNIAEILAGTIPFLVGACAWVL